MWREYGGWGDMVAEVMAGRGGEIDGRWEFWLYEVDTEHTCSVLPGHLKSMAGDIGEVCGMVWICRLRWWRPGLADRVGTRDFDPES